MTDRAVVVTRRRLVVRCLRGSAFNVCNTAVAFHTELPDVVAFQEFWITRSVRSMARCATFGFERRMFEYEWPLLVGMAFDTGRIAADRQFRLFGFESAMCVMAIAALHRSLKNLVVKRFAELTLRFGMATDAQLRFALLQHRDGCRVLFRRFVDERSRSGHHVLFARAMRSVTIGTTNVVPPVFSATEIIVTFRS